jgi:hypothetical protein
MALAAVAGEDFFTARGVEAVILVTSTEVINQEVTAVPVVEI